VRSHHVAQLTLSEQALPAKLQRSVYVPLLDRLLYRHPFEGNSARRYATLERPAFGDLDERLVEQLDLGRAERLLDLGCGPGTFARVAAARHPHLMVVAIDPSRDMVRHRAVPATLRARGEALPLADRSIDVAMLLSSIRHVRDRAQTLRELRRVVRDRVVIVELDPDSDRTRIAAHGDHIGSWFMRHAFGPLVVRTAPPATQIMQLAAAAGFARRTLRPDPVQPVYIMELA
jgi:SAM-dependent methyltransferase